MGFNSAFKELTGSLKGLVLCIFRAVDNKLMCIYHGILNQLMRCLSIYFYPLCVY